MKTMLLIAGAAAIGLTAGASQAATHHRHSAGAASAGAYAEPKQPIPYAALTTYLKASPGVRATRDWSGQMAATTGADVNAAATTAAPPPAAPTQAPVNLAAPTNAPPPASNTQPPQ